jgi:large subunit ribosomal protein L30
MPARSRQQGSTDAQLRVTQVRSAIGTKPKHRGTLRALGLGRIGKTHVLPDRPEVRGMIARVPHLIRVESVTPEEAAAGATTKESE